ncbi:MAG TPA: hypothetical protein VGH28_18475 [Polyangiaceae bacterium]|jgi:hypothetical protein
MRRALAGSIVAIVACAGAPRARPETLAESTNATLAPIASQCALVASCADEHDASAFRTPQSCVDWYIVNARAEAPLADCLIHAKSCADVNACTHPRVDARATTFCKAHPGVLSACDGSDLLTCQGDDGIESTAVDCAKLGGACAERRSGELVVRGCVAPKLCPAGAPEHRCDGDAIVDCQDGIAERNACPAGFHCTAGHDESGAVTARCESAASRDCTLGGAAFCEGDVAYVCVQNGRFTGMHSADCGALGLACAVRAGRVSCVHRGPPACAPDPATCDGDDLRFCAGGDRFRVSCKHLGFAACDPSGGGGEALCK